MLKHIILVCLLFSNQFVIAQELNCQVNVVSPQLQGSTTEKQILEQLQKAIFEFMNNTRWTKESFTINERIDCSMQINVTSKVGSDEYKASIQVQSRRPVYKSSYFSPVFS